MRIVINDSLLTELATRANTCNLSSTTLNPEDLKYLVEELNKHPSITTLNMPRCNLEENVVLLAKLQHIESLDISQNGLDAYGVAEVIRGIPSLKHLDISANSLTFNLETQKNFTQEVVESTLINAMISRKTCLSSLKMPENLENVKNRILSCAQNWQLLKAALTAPDTVKTQVIELIELVTKSTHGNSNSTTVPTMWRKTTTQDKHEPPHPLTPASK